MQRAARILFSVFSPEVACSVCKCKNIPPVLKLLLKPGFWNWLVICPCSNSPAERGEENEKPLGTALP